MPSINVQELTDEVRSQIDEFNSESISQEHILQGLNRSLKAATRITARRLDEVFMAVEVISTSDGVTADDGSKEFEMPADIFGRRIEKVELRQSGSQILWRITRISTKQRDPYVVSSQVNRPYYYDIIGHKLRLYPNPAGSQEVIIHYSRTPDQLVIPQGQINSINTANNYVIVDDIGSDLTTESDNRNSYVNFIDFTTGDVKASMQIAYIDESVGQIKFKSSGLTRDKVYNKDIVTEIPESVTEDDYVCVVKGSCVPQLPDAYVDYLVQHTIVAIKRRLREPTQEEYAALKDIENNLKKLIMGREQQLRIRKAYSHYGRGVGSRTRQYFSTGVN